MGPPVDRSRVPEHEASGQVADLGTGIVEVPGAADAHDHRGLDPGAVPRARCGHVAGRRAGVWREATVDDCRSRAQPRRRAIAGEHIR